GRGQIVAAACAADTVLLATSRGYLLRYHWDEHGNERGERWAASRQLPGGLPAGSGRLPGGFLAA
ncbi:hypothetical protein MNEG_13541, partial [Monoraphidium neglectum]